jgi:hypothetical protein
MRFGKWFVGLVLVAGLGACAPELEAPDELGSAEESIQQGGCSRGEDHAADLVGAHGGTVSGQDCMGCHSGRSAGALKADPGTGLSCMSCHGEAP